MHIYKQRYPSMHIHTRQGHRQGYAHTYVQKDSQRNMIKDTERNTDMHT